MFWSIFVFIGLIILFAWMLFQPMTVKLPTKDKNHPMREVHEYEDVREFPMEDNLDLTAHYHAKEDDTVK